MVDYLVAMGLILIVLVGWIIVEQFSRKFATHHPEFGPAKEEGSGCGKSCQCASGSCKKNA